MRRPPTSTERERAWSTLHPPTRHPAGPELFAEGPLAEGPLGEGPLVQGPVCTTSRATASADSRQPSRPPERGWYLSNTIPRAAPVLLGTRFEHPGRRGQGDGAQPHRHRGVGDQVPDPVGAVTAAGEEVERRAVEPRTRSRSRAGVPLTRPRVVR